MSDGMADAERQPKWPRYVVFSHILPLSFQCVWHAFCSFVVTMRLVGEVSEGEFLFPLTAVFFHDAPVSLAGQRHTEGQSLLALLYVRA